MIFSRYYDGTDDYSTAEILQAGSSPSPCIACWVRPVAWPGSQATILNLSSFDLGTGHNWRMAVTNAGALKCYAGASASVTTGLTLLLDTWNFIAWQSIASTTQVAWCNGETEASSLTQASMTSITQVNCGVFDDRGSKSEYFNGYIARPTVWFASGGQTIPSPLLIKMSKGWAPDKIEIGIRYGYWDFKRDGADFPTAQSQYTSTPVYTTHGQVMTHTGCVLAPSGGMLPQRLDTVTIAIRDGGGTGTGVPPLGKLSRWTRLSPIGVPMSASGTLISPFA